MRTLPHILSEGLFTDRNTSIQMNDLTARTVAAALYSPLDDTFKKIRTYLSRSPKTYAVDEISFSAANHKKKASHVIDHYIRKKQEVLMLISPGPMDRFGDKSNS